MTPYKSATPDRRQGATSLVRYVTCASKARARVDAKQRYRIPRSTRGGIVPDPATSARYPAM